MSYSCQQLIRVAVASDPGWELRGPVHGVQVLKNALVESGLINARSVTEFLLANRQKGSLHYSLYLPSWSNEAVQLAYDAWQTLSRYAAHPTVRSANNLFHPGEWPLPELALVFGGAFADFVQVLSTVDPDRARWFRPDPNLELKPLRANQPSAERESENPDVGDLSRALRAYLGLSLSS